MQKNNKKFSATYLTPQYYNKILKTYSSQGTDDLEIFTEFLSKQKHYNNILELGCGSGRSTQTILDNCSFNSLTLTDLSTNMLDFTKASVLEARSQKPEARSQKPEARSQKPEAR